MDITLKVLPRKDWLLVLWDYHHGHLPPEKREAVEDLVRDNLDARADSERVLEIINELRQIGRWDPSPEFRLEALDRLIRAGQPSARHRALLACAALLILLLVLYLLLRGEEVRSNLVPATPSPETMTHFMRPADISVNLPRPDIPDRGGSLWIDSAPLELRDPVSVMETEMDNRFPAFPDPSP